MSVIAAIVSGMLPVVSFNKKSAKAFVAIPMT